MLKSIIFRRENWLLFFPLLFLTFNDISVRDTSIDFHLHDTYYIITTKHAWTWILLLVLLPYSLHFMLRLNNKGDKRIQTIHICVTLFCYVAGIAAIIFSFFELNKYGFSNWKDLNKGQYLFIILEIIYLINQLLFILYFLNKIFKEKLFD